MGYKTAQWIFRCEFDEPDKAEDLHQIEVTMFLKNRLFQSHAMDHCHLFKVLTLRIKGKNKRRKKLPENIEIMPFHIT